MPVCVSLLTTTNGLFSRNCKKQCFCRTNLQIRALRKLWGILLRCTKASQPLPPCCGYYMLCVGGAMRVNCGKKGWRMGTNSLQKSPLCAIFCPFHPAIAITSIKKAKSGKRQKRRIHVYEVQTHKGIEVRDTTPPSFISTAKRCS